MNIKEILTATIDFFKKHKIPDPRLDAEVLLGHLLDIERIQLYVKYDLPLEPQEVAAYRELVRKRAERVPVAYLTGEKEFMSLPLVVNENVLIPRPETELLVEYVIDYCQDKEIDGPNIVDVGTGSGAIAVSLAHYLPAARVLGIDLSAEALAVARLNIDKLGYTGRVKVIKGNLLKPLLKMEKDNVDIIVSNPPYIPRNELGNLSPEVRQEPWMALDGGKDGLDYYRQLIKQAKAVLVRGGIIVLEIAYNQGKSVVALFDDNWEDIKVKKDYAGSERLITAALV
ncbi:peptide chain release factor N(5)-glutamine methyltransferase [Halocella sp. SP3-1]|uniref:peptide chain release factor N(5)-glutamine methyltransferase n=1 Tax=Halocella sp. SP3-1 TaxID=2382161 RepID=UPI000F74EEAC|nr:peptide chain release factor N(5)-glutamine methyltransferase [Halocella sp. SP3-1]AZO93934.1 peptide chain release factor N(5)-glutamine methyltransferase [Halocella sp. SP3-1]